MHSKKIAAAIAGTALTACLIASLALNVYQLGRFTAQEKKINKFIDNQLERQAEEEKKENTYQEDGFVISNEYEIISTTAISDAYKSGKSDNLNAQDKETLALAGDVLKKIIKDGMSAYEKELAVYEWMYKNVKQNSGTVVQLPGTSGRNAYTPYNVLSGQNAVCVGYATTFRLFMQMLGFECHIVHNDYHSWDIVQLDDKEWYQVDVYTDVSSGCQYQNFNISDAISRNSHEWDDSALPSANGIKYLYAVQSSREIKDIYTVPKKIKKALDKKKSSAFYKFKNKLSKEDLPIADLLVNQMNMILPTMPGFETYNISGVWYQDENEAYILGIYLTNYGATAENAFDENSPEGKKMTEAVSAAFGTDVPQDSTNPMLDGMAEKKKDDVNKNDITDNTTEQATNAQATVTAIDANYTQRR